MIPAFSHTGIPRHFTASTTSGTARRMSARTRASVSPRQSFRCWICASICSEGEDGSSCEAVVLVGMGGAAAFVEQASLYNNHSMKTGLFTNHSKCDEDAFPKFISFIHVVF